MSTSPSFDVLALGAIQPLAQDDRATVYAAPGLTVPGIANPAYREYRRAASAEMDAVALAAMCDHLAALPSSSAAADLLAVAAWPCGFVQSAGVFRGVVVPAPPDGFVPLVDVLTPDAIVGSDSAIDPAAHTWLASTVAALLTLHRQEIVVGDLLSAGLLVPPTPGTAGVFFAQADRMLLRGVPAAPQAEAEAEGWEVGASHPGEEPRTPQSDIFKVGLLALRLLTGDAAARDPAALPSEVPDELRRLVQASIAGPPADRPALVDWPSAIDEAAEVASGRPHRSTATKPAATKSAAASGSTAATSPPAAAPADPATSASTWLPPAVRHAAAWTTAIVRGGPGSGPSTNGWRRPVVAVGAALAAVAFLVAAIALAGGDREEETSAVGFDDTGPASTVDATTSTTGPTTTSEPEASTTTTLATVEGWFQPGVAADCDLTAVTLVGEDRAAVECGESWQVVDLRTGDVTSVAQGASSDLYDLEDAIVGDRYLWWDIVDVPASGLDPPTRTFTLRSRAIAGGDEQELVVLTGDEYSNVSVTGAWGSRLLSYEHLTEASPSHQVLREADGTEIARFEGTADSGYAPTDGIVSAGSVSIDLTTGQAVALDVSGLESGFDPCAQAGVLNSWSDPVVVRRGPDGLHEGAAVPQIDYGVTSVGSGDQFYGGGSSGGLSAYDAQGTLLWELPYEVARSWSVFGGTPFVVNASDEIVAVDPATGQEGTVSAELLEAATVHMQSGEIAVDSATGNVLLHDYDRGLRFMTLPECQVR